jgi:hypothetical protein
VANQTLGGEELAAHIRERVAAGPSHFHVLVPATPAHLLEPEPDAPPELDEEQLLAREMLEAEDVDDARAGRFTEGRGRARARERLRHELERLRELEVDASGEVGVSDPVDAIRTVLHRYEFDEIILSTLPERRSRWLAMDLPARIRRGTKLPVTQIICQTPPAL